LSTSCGTIVFLADYSFAVLARWKVKTVADFVRARASFWIEVFGGSIPRASREVRVRGRRRSWYGSQFMQAVKWTRCAAD